MLSQRRLNREENKEERGERERAGTERSAEGRQDGWAGLPDDETVKQTSAGRRLSSAAAASLFNQPLEVPAHTHRPRPTSSLLPPDLSLLVLSLPCPLSLRMKVQHFVFGFKKGKTTLQPIILIVSF